MGGCLDVIIKRYSKAFLESGIDLRHKFNLTIGRYPGYFL